MPRSAARPPRPPKLGQNFLADPSAARKIVDALGDVSHSTVVEIGPGHGALTEVLANRAGELVAIELDRVLGAQLRMKFANQKNVEILEGNVLDVDFASLMHRTRRTSGDIRGHNDSKAVVVGNIPYYITSPILLHLFRYSELISQIVIMVQREVAERIAAKPGGSEYGLLSATAQFYAQVEKLFVLPPGAFSPPPKVHSAVLRLTIAPQAAQLGVSETEFMEFLKLAFAQKRKTLVNNLKARYTPAAIRAATKSAGVKA
ncbi:MAG: ribosomal RNA small subunit methyltransferase A, partial [Acidobacteria bacterium]|nr:ribosomal RNA small subunit methyltransferase A [Acidobacteriota bacterium]